jgi:putative transposase
MKPPPAKDSAGAEFLEYDRVLDKAVCGPSWLKEPQIAAMLVHGLQFCERQLCLYRLHAFVVMSNHEYVLFEPLAPVAQITKTLKGFTARRANEALHRTGQPFWQDESFDHWIRHSREFERVTHYIENNPVKAGLVSRSSLWPWSSATK